MCFPGSRALQQRCRAGGGGCSSEGQPHQRCTPPQTPFYFVLRAQADYELPCTNPISDGCRDLLRRMLAADPAKRATAHEILEHPWFCQVRDCEQH